MKRKTLETAINEARRFLTRAESYLTEVDPLKKKPHLSGGTKKSASVLRASMDLTRALADLRQGR
jgi:hypothetical protein